MQARAGAARQMVPSRSELQQSVERGRCDKRPHLVCCMLGLSLLTDSVAHCYRKPRRVPSAGPTHCSSGYTLH